ncbi:hypothetical protein QYE76_014080 [Lolium multiflorum]|uniref:Uncharacterized protein n=1 Tax=Lolium multiflorum TaxID=4521 RepID=A0AAD8X556_LOLMU|nr:hypothetical protein QYE76_014080 [Lolium multiflorum]
MPPRKLTKHNAHVSKMATTDLGNNEWERSKISQQDINLLKKLGISSKQDSLRFPKEESYPRPPMEYRVSFVDHLIRGVSSPIHDFLRGLLFINPSKEIFSELDEINAQVLFLHEASSPKRRWGHEVADTSVWPGLGRAACGVATP